MTIEALERVALELLGQLCERQAELSDPAHVAVMEAFNACVDNAPAPPLFYGSSPDDSIGALLRRTSEALGVLAASEVQLGVHLRYAEARTLIDLAISES
jgi:hypothetical protein